MDDGFRKIDLSYFDSCCRVSRSNTKGQGKLTFLTHLNTWVHDRLDGVPFKPSGYGEELEKQYVEAIVKAVEESKSEDFDPRAILMDYLKDLDSMP